MELTVHSFRAFFMAAFNGERLLAAAAAAAYGCYLFLRAVSVIMEMVTISCRSE